MPEAHQHPAHLTHTFCCWAGRGCASVHAIGVIGKFVGCGLVESFIPKGCRGGGGGQTVVLALSCLWRMGPLRLGSCCPFPLYVLSFVALPRPSRTATAMTVRLVPRARWRFRDMVDTIDMKAE